MSGDIDFYGDDRTVDVHIKRLRTKISTDEQPFFHTVWGVGYRFDETAWVIRNENQILIPTTCQSFKRHRHCLFIIKFAVFTLCRAICL